MPERWTASCYDLSTTIEVVAILDGCVVGCTPNNRSPSISWVHEEEKYRWKSEAYILHTTSSTLRCPLFVGSSRKPCADDEGSTPWVHERSIGYAGALDCLLL